MDIYKNLVEKGYLKGDNNNYPISLKGIEKLASKFKEKYNFINIKIINEREILNNFNYFNNISKNYIEKYPFIYEKFKKEQYDSSRQDDLFKQLKEFNKRYEESKAIKNIEFFFSKNYDLFVTLFEFYTNKENVLNDLMCKMILKIEKEKDLNFFIWVDEKEKHFSLVVNIDESYYFLDSCSTFYERWPTKTIISKNNEKSLFNKFKTFVIFSFLQMDIFNCASFVFAFIKIIADLYKKLNKQGLMNYFQEYFKYLWKDRFLTEVNNLYFSEKLSFKGSINLFVLPAEILSLSQSKFMLKSLKDSIIKYTNENDLIVIVIKNIIKDIEKKGYKIDDYRKLHLKLLMED